MDAKNNPIFQTGSEFHTGDVKPGRRKARDLDNPDDNEPMIALAEGIDADAEAYQAEMKFMEEPVTIRLAPSNEKNPPRTVQCWVNGKGAEQFVNGKWMVCGWLPINHTVTTKRKYVEVLARAKNEAVSTRVVKHETHEDNLADRIPSCKYPFSVLRDENPRGHDWLATILQEQ